MSDLQVIDGSRGEGGGQVLRTSLSLAAALGRPVRIENVRAGRPKPGLLRQHLTALKAAREISGGGVMGAELGSQQVELHPGPVRAGDYRFEVGSAGSATLVLQTVLIPLALADGPSTVRITGGTHNPWAPPFEFLARSFLPLMARMGIEAEARLVRPGFYPAGGGEIEVEIRPRDRDRAFDLLERGQPQGPVRAVIVVSHLPAHVAARETETLRRELGIGPECVQVNDCSASAIGPGNAVHVISEFERVTEVASAFGKRGVPAARVAQSVAKDAGSYLVGSHPVGEYLCDQLLLPLALLGGGRFRTGALSLHAKTNIDTISAFLPGRFQVDRGPDGADDGEGAVLVEVSGERISAGGP